MKNRLRRLMVFGVGVEIKGRDEVAELVGGHVDPDVFRDRFGDLLSERLLAFGLALSRDEQKSVRIGVNARQDVTSIPAQPPCDIGRNFDRQIPIFGLGLFGGNVQQQSAFRPIRLQKVASPM